MKHLGLEFDGGAHPKNISTLFSSEKKIRNNHLLFRNHCYAIFAERNLPLSKIALDFYLDLVQKAGSQNKKALIRKDGDTPREQHEESHIVTGDALLKVVGNNFIKPEFGSEDAFFAAIVLHDVIEDLDQSGNDIREVLENGLKKMYLSGNISKEKYAQGSHDIKQIITIVELLSRKDKDGVRLDDDRIQQAKQWQKHPYCHPIKLIDWCNKLQTMVGVNHFEDNAKKKMTRVINETSLIFVDEQQAMTQKAIQKYPFIKEVCAPLEGIMGVLFQTLNTYVKLKSGEFKFDPAGADPFNFDRYLAPSQDLLKALPEGNNYITPTLDRLKAVGETDYTVNSFLNHMALPSLNKPPIRKLYSNNNKLIVK